MNAGTGAARPSAAHRSRSASRIAIDVARMRRLGVLGQVEGLGRAVPGERADRLAEGGIGGGEDGCGGGRPLGEGTAHADGLGTLSGAHEGDVGHARSVLGSARSLSAATVHGCTHLGRCRTLSTVSDERPPTRPSTRPAPTRAIARRFEADLSAPVLAAGNRLPNVRQISERVAMGRALWRELVIGFAGQLGELRLGFTQLAALYVLADGNTLTVGELAEAIGRSPSATSRLVDGLVRRRLVERHEEPEDRRQRTLRLTQRGHAVLRVVDRGRADQFLSAVRPLPTAERAIVAMGVAALATHAISRRGRLIRTTPE